MSTDRSESHPPTPDDEESSSEAPVGTLLITFGFLAMTAVLWFWVYFTLVRRG